MIGSIIINLKIYLSPLAKHYLNMKSE